MSKFITVSGIDRSGKTSIIKALMEETQYRNFIVDRDPSNFYGLSVIQNNRGITEDYKNQYKKLKKKFSKLVDIAVFLYCDPKELVRRFVETDEPDIVGDLCLTEHQDFLLKCFKEYGYKKFIIVNTAINSVEQCVRMILINLYTISNKQTIFYGDKFKLNCGSIAKVIDYKNKNNVFIRTDTGYETYAQVGQLKDGRVKDKLTLTVFGVGYIGIGKHKSDSIAGTKWRDMLERVYHNIPNAYQGITVNENWHCFQKFADWFELNYIEGYELDKDLKLYGNKTYCENSCIFVPRKLNVFFYNKEKNQYCKLPHGVIKSGGNSTKFTSAIEYSSTNTIQESMNNYWNQKYLKMQKLIKIYPKFKNLLENYFEHFFNEHYREDI